MDSPALSVSYRLIAELLLHPDDRDEARVVSLRAHLQSAPAGVAEVVLGFLADPAAYSRDEYVRTIELSPPCPLYLGAYLFDEPTTCRGAGTSGRNAYMLELAGIYRHFGFGLLGRELPDYLPIVVDFLWISLEHRERDGIGLRRRFVEHYVRPGLGPLYEKLSKYESPYALLVSGLQYAVEEDLKRMENAPAWQPPAQMSRGSRQLPVLTEGDGVTVSRKEMQL